MVYKITKTEIIGIYSNDYGRKYYLREMARLLGKPHQTVKPYAEELAKEGVLRKTTRKSIVEYCIDFRNKTVYDYLVIAEKERTLRRLATETYLRILFESLTESFINNIFVVFGSSVDRIRDGSDIDILSIGKDDVAGITNRLESVYNKKIHLIHVNNISEL